MRICFTWVYVSYMRWASHESYAGLHKHKRCCCTLCYCGTTLSLLVHDESAQNCYLCKLIHPRGNIRTPSYVRPPRLSPESILISFRGPCIWLIFLQPERLPGSCPTVMAYSCIQPYHQAMGISIWLTAELHNVKRICKESIVKHHWFPKDQTICLVPMVTFSESDNSHCSCATQSQQCLLMRPTAQPKTGFIRNICSSYIRV